MSVETDARDLFNAMLANLTDLDGVPLANLTTTQRFRLLGLFAASIGWVGPGQVVKLPAMLPTQVVAPLAEENEEKPARKPRKRRGG